jgi:hypothetical protein
MLLFVFVDWCTDDLDQWCVVVIKVNLHAAHLCCLRDLWGLRNVDRLAGQLQALRAVVWEVPVDLLRLPAQANARHRGGGQSTVGCNKVFCAFVWMCAATLPTTFQFRQSIGGHADPCQQHASPSTFSKTSSRYQRCVCYQLSHACLTCAW